jgi:hypothetical protein
VQRSDALLASAAWRSPDGAITYCSEGSIFVTGAAVQWLRDGLGIIDAAGELEALAASVPDADGVVLVPAFTGLGSPWWDPYARGTLVGITRGTGRAHLARAVVDAMEDFPHLNASVGDGELLVHNPVHLAIAVDLDFEGLLAPVVRNTESKRLRAIAREIRDLADRAHQKKLSADEIQGGTFTITNPGQYGTMLQFPVINQPQVAILSTDGVHRKPVVVTAPDGTEAIAVHSVGVLALAWDHRAFDGAYAAAFLARLREIIETRDWEAEL